MDDVVVKSFDEKKAEEELKKCPEIVRDYVKLLKGHCDVWKDISNKAIKKLKERCEKCKR